ncbi:MAG TPA: amino acid racemase [Bacillota bacterium]|nr:amino acid racemase [Bacillota bacterium]HOG52773.1 amino acid racemase [Bacillota bacterium]
MEETRTIGILGGMGPLATAYFLTRFVQLTDADKDQDHLHIIVDDYAMIPDRTAHIEGKGPDPLPYMIEAGLRLRNAGAEIIAMPCNTAHHYFEPLKRAVGVDFVHMPRTAAEDAARLVSPGGKVGVLATVGTISNGIYRRELEALGYEEVVPDAEGQGIVTRAIYDGVKAGKGPESASEFMYAVEELRGKGAEAIILGCTELSVIGSWLGLKDGFIDAMDSTAVKVIRMAGGKAKPL